MDFRTSFSLGSIVQAQYITNMRKMNLATEFEV